LAQRQTLSSNLAITLGLHNYVTGICYVIFRSEQLLPNLLNEKVEAEFRKIDKQT